MSWNNRNNYSGRNNYRPNNDYPQRGGYYDDRRPQYRQPIQQHDDHPILNFPVGTKCTLKAYPDITVSIIRLGNEQYECRLPDLRTEWFYEHELIPIDEK